MAYHNTHNLDPLAQADETHYLRRTNCLPIISGNAANSVTFIKYCTSRAHAENLSDIDGNNEQINVRAWAPGTTPTAYTAGTFALAAREFEQYGAGYRGDIIDVAYFGTCSRVLANEIIGTLTGRVDPSLAWNSIIPPDPTIPNPNAPVSAIGQGSSNLENHGDFITGLSINAKFPTQIPPSTTKALVLLVAMPYLGQKRPNHVNQSLSLHAYSLRRTALPSKPGSEELNLRVHQAWFAVFDDFRIAVFKSPDDPNSNRVPLFYYQRRIDAFYALLQMLSNLFAPSETSPIKLFRNKINELLHTLDHTDPTMTPKEDLQYKREVRAGLEFLVSNLCSVIELVEEQIEILRSLEFVYANQQRAGMGPPHRNMMHLPFIKGVSGINAGESMGEGLKSVQSLINERERSRRDLISWLGEVRFRQSSFSEQASVDLQKNAFDVVKKQGETITVFTLITTVFLPLGFLSQYYSISLDDTEGKISSYREFWTRTGPITVGILLITALFLYLPDHVIKDRLKRAYHAIMGP